MHLGLSSTRAAVQDREFFGLTPNGTILPKFNNFASAFNVLGTDDTPGPGVTLWAGCMSSNPFPTRLKR